MSSRTSHATACRRSQTCQPRHAGNPPPCPRCMLQRSLATTPLVGRRPRSPHRPCHRDWHLPPHRPVTVALASARRAAAQRPLPVCPRRLPSARPAPMQPSRRLGLRRGGGRKPLPPPTPSARLPAVSRHRRATKGGGTTLLVLLRRSRATRQQSPLKAPCSRRSPSCRSPLGEEGIELAVFHALRAGIALRSPSRLPSCISPPEAHSPPLPLWNSLCVLTCRFFIKSPFTPCRPPAFTQHCQQLFAAWGGSMLQWRFQPQFMVPPPGAVNSVSQPRVCMRRQTWLLVWCFWGGQN